MINEVILLNEISRLNTDDYESPSELLFVLIKASYKGDHR